MQVLGNPYKMFSTNLICLIDVESRDENNLVGYKISLYGLIVTIAVIIVIITVELAIYFIGKLIK